MHIDLDQDAPPTTSKIDHAVDNIKPFLKWAGGKRWLVSSPDFSPPQNFNNYYEPFIGGGSVLFKLAPKSGVISDANPDLINFYKTLRDKPNELRELMVKHQKKHSKEYYYKIRSQQIDNRVEMAARFLYLNRACWNGLYRVNLSGQFNVPIGTKKTVHFVDDDFSGASDLLKRYSVLECDFEETISKAQDGDFVFADPPYTVRHNMNGFVKYNEKIFSWDDQVRLRDTVFDAAKRGASILVSNADHESIREIYADATKLSTVTRNSVIAGKSTARGSTTELLIEI